jgi:hypothetical protein
MKRKGHWEAQREGRSYECEEETCLSGYNSYLNISTNFFRTLQWDIENIEVRKNNKYEVFKRKSAFLQNFFD